MEYIDLYQTPTSKQAKLDKSYVGARTTTRNIKLTHVGPGLREKIRELSYRAAKPSKFRNIPNNLGGSADSHYYNSLDFFNLREYARAWDRDTPLLGQAVDRGLDQLLGTGLRVDPQTDDENVNDKLKALWVDWSNNPETCDFSAKFTFSEMERLALRHQWIDGDCFVLLDDATGSVRLVEGDRVDSSTGQVVLDNGRELVHGVEVDPDSGKPHAYYFVNYEAGERQRQRRIIPAVGSDRLIRIPREFVIHIFDPKRITQTRGITAFSGVFDRIDLLENLEFALLVQHQVAACISAFITSENNIQFGPRSEETQSDGTVLSYDEFSPGMIARLNPGENIETFSPNNPTADALQFARNITRQIGLAIGLPIELTLLDTSQGVFHSYRGAIESYKRTARRMQKVYSARFRSRVYRWKVQEWIDDGLITARPDIFRHNIQHPAWAYVDPFREAQADSLRIRDNLASPRQVWAERGRDYQDGVNEIVEDKSLLISSAQERAKELGVEWQELLGLTVQNLVLEDTEKDAKAAE